MKAIEKKVAIIFTATLLLSLLVVRLLPEGDCFDGFSDWEMNTHSISMDECFDMDGVSLGFTIGREITMNL
ncbi:hypothetical protein [Saccharicrinis fermentans]|uniref:Uncharacterized protein n=1 Tax=Saccharicrinis fermentans DSM 9555 = JCM 21142 TaxID=869213 RepID=W7XWT4_9BACT|nr:hypothetical protein [Saccharicrinis fermentans]GAF02830.1 hypothetical protein JCM21142_41475 [Saccharicrinis fermentans DSM 9555 = JCM 21142]